MCECGTPVSVLEDSCHQCVSVVHLSQCWKNVSLVCECGTPVSVLEEMCR